jgi:Zn-dependent protease
MLGRITLNPIKHIDPVGTLLLPLIALLTGIPMLGWAKPTPVDPRNFRNPMADDIKTSVVGPASNFVLATGALLILMAIAAVSPAGSSLIGTILSDYPDLSAITQSRSLLMPVCMLIYDLMSINVILGVFNLIPVPPLDGSHVLRHFLPGPILKIYDTVGWLGLMALVYLGGGLIWKVISPVLGVFENVLFLVVRSR